MTRPYATRCCGIYRSAKTKTSLPRACPKCELRTRDREIWVPLDAESRKGGRTRDPRSSGSNPAGGSR